MKSPTTFTTLFYFSTIQTKYLATLITLFYFITIKVISLTMLTTVLLRYD